MLEGSPAKAAISVAESLRSSSPSISSRKRLTLRKGSAGGWVWSRGVGSSSLTAPDALRDDP